jgi:hypothetical protein
MGKGHNEKQRVCFDVGLSPQKLKTLMKTTCLLTS